MQKAVQCTKGTCVIYTAIVRIGRSIILLAIVCIAAPLAMPIPIVGESRRDYENGSKLREGTLFFKLRNEVLHMIRNETGDH